MLDYNNIDWEDIVEYDETSSTFLRWKVARYKGINKIKTSDVGDEAGYFDANGYSRLTINGNKYSNHRIIWILHHSIINNEMFIDHIDGCRSNNKIENLRLVTREFNNRNASKLSNNTSGINGVYLNTSANSYTAVWYILSGTKRSKSFSIDKYGKELAFKLACEYRDNIINTLNQYGAGYSDRHGT